MPRMAETNNEKYRGLCVSQIGHHLRRMRKRIAMAYLWSVCVPGLIFRLRFQALEKNWAKKQKWTANTNKTTRHVKKNAKKWSSSICWLESHSIIPERKNIDWLWTKKIISSALSFQFGEFETKTVQSHLCAAHRRISRTHGEAVTIFIARWPAIMFGHFFAVPSTLIRSNSIRRQHAMSNCLCVCRP